MSIMTSLYSGTTGLEANSTELSVIGDNIANANTIGFKSSRVAFEDTLSQNIVNSGQMGLGTRIQLVQKIMTQGALTSTGLATDLALSGNGFFMVNGAHDGKVSNYYTRAGQFTLDKDGYLTNLDGLRVQGYMANAVGVIGGAPADLGVGNAGSSPNPTATIQVKANLQSDATVPPAWNPADPVGTSNFSSATTVYDSLGAAHEVNIYYRRSGNGTWEWHGMADGGGLAGGTAGTLEQVANGTLTYDSAGRLSAQTQASSFNPVGANGPQALTFNFGDPTGSGGTGLLGITQFSSASSTTFISQDGYPSGQLASISVDTQGVVTGAFTNGQSRALGQVAVATFQGEERLERVGGNLFQVTPESGAPAIGAPGEGGRGSVVAGALEQSNVDLASQFVRMIAAQRGFQANSKTISTADQLLAELMTLKR
jgi:flagellar hook protein FlgE